MTALERAGVPVEISTLPSEVPDPIPFPEDTVHATLDAAAVTRFWRVLLAVEAVLREHRARSAARRRPWSSGGARSTSRRRASPAGRSRRPPDADAITRIGGDEEQYCAGFWPGNARTPYPAFFAYLYPKPDGIERAPLWNDELGEFLLPYDEVRASGDPRRALLDFLDSTFERSWPLPS